MVTKAHAAHAPPAGPAESRAQADGRRRLAMRDALDFSSHAQDMAGEAWSLLSALLFVDGRPRFPAIAAEFDLSPPQAVVLRLLTEPRPMGELATAMACDNSNITGIIDRLEERGLVERRAAAQDRRVKLIAATPAGEKLREELSRRFAVAPAPLQRLSAADQRALRDILRRALDA